MPLVGLLVDSTQVRKEFLSSLIIIHQQIPQKPQSREQRLEEKQNIQLLWHSNKRYDMCVMGLLKGEEKERETEEIFKTIITENFSKLKKIEDQDSVVLVKVRQIDQ